MAVTSCEPIRCLAMSETDGGGKTAAVLWRVIISDKSVGYQTVLAYSGLPKRGDSYSFNGERDSNLFVTTRDVKLAGKEESQRLVLHVTVNYSTQSSTGDTSQPPDESSNPLDMRPQVEIITQRERKPILFDLDGEIIASSADEPYDPVQERDNTRAVLRITRNVATYEWWFNKTLKDSVNSQPIFDAIAGELKMAVPGAWKLMYHASGLRYYQETWEFEYCDYTEAGAPLGHQLKLYDWGMYRIDGVNRHILTDAAGHPLTGAAFLDGNGAVLDPGDPPFELPEFKRYPARNWNDIRPQLPDFWR